MLKVQFRNRLNAKGETLGYCRFTVKDSTNVSHRVVSPNFVGRTRTAVKQAAQEWLDGGGLEKLRAKFEPKPAVFTCGEFLGAWFDASCKAWAPKTTQTNKFNWEKHVTTDLTLWNCPLTDFDLIRCKAFIARVNGSENTRHNIVKLVRPAFATAVREGRIPTNPFSLLNRSERPRKSKSRVVAISEAEERTLVRYSLHRADPFWRSLLLFMLSSGCEPQEFAGVCEGDVDWHRGEVHIRRTVDEIGGVPIVKDTMKAAGRNRWVRVDGITLEALRAYLSQGTPPCGHVWTEPDGSLLHYSRWLKRWRKMLTDAGCSYFPPLSLRHTWATRALSSGESLLAVCRQLGHANATVTLSTYAHAMPRDTERLAKATEARFGRYLAAEVSQIGAKLAQKRLTS